MGSEAEAASGNRQGPVNQERHPHLSEMYDRLLALVPFRTPCTRVAARGVVSLWKEWRERLSPGRDLEGALMSMRSDMRCYFEQGHQFADYLCTLLEAHLAEGKMDDVRAMLDWVICQRPMQESTRQRVEAVQRRLADPRLGKSLTEREQSVLQVLPAVSQDQIAKRIECGEGTVKKILPVLQADGLVQKLHGCWVRTESGDYLLEAALALQARAAVEPERTVKQPMPATAKKRK